MYHVIGTTKNTPIFKEFFDEMEAMATAASERMAFIKKQHENEIDKFEKTLKEKWETLAIKLADAKLLPPAFDKEKQILAVNKDFGVLFIRDKNEAPHPDVFITHGGCS